MTSIRFKTLLLGALVSSFVPACTGASADVPDATDGSGRETDGSERETDGSGRETDGSERETESTLTGAEPGAESTGGSTGGTSGAEPGECERSATVLASLDELGPTGIDARSRVNSLTGRFAGWIRWEAASRADADDAVSYLGKPTESPLIFEIAYDGGEVRDVQSTLLRSCIHDGPCFCSDAVEVDMTIRFESEDGVFDETRGVTVRFREASELNPPTSDFRVELDPDDIQGTFSLSQVEVAEPLSVEGIYLSGSVGTEGTLFGGLSLELHGGDKKVWPEMFVPTLARFGGLASRESCDSVEPFVSCDLLGCVAVEGGCEAP